MASARRLFYAVPALAMATVTSVVPACDVSSLRGGIAVAGDQLLNFACALRRYTYGSGDELGRRELSANFNGHGCNPLLECYIRRV
jgi:hypothetical protein